MPTPEFTHPQQLTDFLSATIGEEVLQQMEKEAPMQRAGNPLPVPTQANPADQQPVQPASPQAPAHVQADPAPQAAPTDTSGIEKGGQPAPERLVLGKYRTEKEAEDAYHRLLHANKELMRQLDQAKGQSSPLTAPVPQPQTRLAPAERSGNLEELRRRFTEKYTVDFEDFEDLTRSIAQESVNAALKPRDEYAEADQFMARSYPESVAKRDELVQFATTDGETAEMVSRMWANGDYKAAMEYAWLKYDLAVRTATERKMIANETVRQEEVAAARRDAGLLQTQATGVHETPPQQLGPTSEENEQLAAMYRAGYKEPWLRANIGRTLPDELFGIGQ